MSRILRRPMFRGGRVDGRGTGITSGLGYEKGGRVGYEPGGAVTGGDIMARLSNFFNSPALNPDGTPVTLPRRNIVDDAAFLIGPGKFAKAGGAGLNLIKSFSKANKFPPGYPQRGLKQTGGYNLETLMRDNKFLSNQYLKDAISPIISGGKEILKPIGTAAKEYTLPFGIGALLTGAAGKMGYDAFTDDDKEDPDLEKIKKDEFEQQQREALEKILDDQLSNKKEKVKDSIGGKDAIKESTKEYAEILGKDKARGKDVTDMLLSFAGKALKPEATVKGAFGEFFEEEAKRTGRGEKIDQAAATLAINEYIAGKKSKAELDRFFAQADYSTALKSRTGKKNIPINITDAAKSFGTGYKAIDFGLKISFPESQTNKMDASEGQTVDKVPLTVDNIGQIFIEDEAPYNAIMVTIEDGELIRDPLN
jgi:hypothetical protein